MNMNNIFSIQSISITLVLAGVIMLMVSVSQSILLCKESKPVSKNGWKILLLMMVAFIGGYLTFIVYLFRYPAENIELMLSAILFGGGAFVVLVIKMSLISIQNEQHVTEQLRIKARDLEYQKSSLDEHAIVSITDSNGVITYVNDKFTDISGYSRDEAIGSNHSLVNSGYHSEQFWKDLWETISHGEVWHDEIRNLGKNGNGYWVETTIVPFLNESGIPYQYVAIRNNITRLKEQEAQQELRQKRMSMQQCSLLEAAEFATLNNVDFSGAIREILRISAQTLGAVRSSLWLFESQIVLEHTSILYDNESESIFNTFDLEKENYPEYFRSIGKHKLLHTSNPTEDENYKEFVRLNDIQEDVELILDASIAHCGDIMGLLRIEDSDSQRSWYADEQYFIASIADLISLTVINSSRVKMDRKLTKVALELDVKNKDLEKALSASEESGKAKSEFLSTMSHELRTPMNGIMGMLSILNDLEEDEEKNEYIEAAYKSSESLLDLLNDLLDYSKIEADKIELEDIEFSMRHIMKNMNDMMGANLKGKNIEFSWKVSDKIPSSVLGDAGRLRQILMNIIGNAIKFTKTGKILVDINELDNNDKDICTLIFRISDTGVGIPKDRIGDIFEAFTQADGSITRRYGGTGLGLSICKNLIELMSGDITVESTEGVGSTFTFTINLKHTVHSIYTGGSIPDIREVRILIADSCKFDRNAIEVGLNRYKLEVSWVDAGYQIVNRLHAAAKSGHPFQYAILDSRVSDLDILELAKIIKADPVICNTRLIMTVERGEPGHGKSAFNAGFHAYLTWPINSKIIVRCINLSSSHLGGDTLITRHTIDEFKEISGEEILFISNLPSEHHSLSDLLNEIGFSCRFLNYQHQDIINIDRFQLVLLDLMQDEVDNDKLKKVIGAIIPQSSNTGFGNRGSGNIVVGVVSENTKNYIENYKMLGIDNFITYSGSSELLEENIDQLLLMDSTPENKRAI